MRPQHLWLVAAVLLVTLSGAMNSSAQSGGDAQSEAVTIYDASGAVLDTGPAELSELAPQAAPDAELAATLMTEGFEDAWPGPGWTVDDLSNTDGGEFVWGKRNCAPRTGAYAAWVVGGGSGGSALDCADQYPNNARVRVLFGPFDLRGATSAALTYHLTGQLEGGATCPFDYLGVASGTSLSGTYTGNAPVCGDLRGSYNQRTLNLNSRLGQSQVWVAFFFVTDSSVVFNGFSIDDIALQVETATITPTVTRTATATPPATATPTHTATVTATPTTTATATVPAVATASPTQAIGPVAPPNTYLPLMVKLLPTPTPTVPPPTATPAPDPVPYEQAVINTAAGPLRITEIQRYSTFPPDCSPGSISCQQARPGYTVVYLWVERTDGVPVNGSQLFDAIRAASVTIVAGNNSSAQFVGTVVQNGRAAMAFANSVNDTGLRLVWPGNPPVLLDR